MENVFTKLVAEFAEAHGFEFYQGVDAPEKIRNYKRGDLMLHFISRSDNDQTGQWRMINEGFKNAVSHGGTGMNELKEWLDTQILPNI